MSRRGFGYFFPGSGEKCTNLSVLSRHSSASAGAAFLRAIFGQITAYSAFNLIHFSAMSESGLIASTGHSGSQTPQSMHSSEMREWGQTRLNKL